MTVRELVLELLKVPGDLPVFLGDWNEQWENDVPLMDASEVSVLEPITARAENLPKRLRIGDGRRYRPG